MIWGLVHAFAGIIILSGDTTAGFQAIADAVPPGDLAMDYPAALGGVLGQHAWNLAWFGLATIIGGILIWRGNMTAIWVTAMVGGLADLGYFIFIDLARICQLRTRYCDDAGVSHSDCLEWLGLVFYPYSLNEIPPPETI